MNKESLLEVIKEGMETKNKVITIWSTNDITFHVTHKVRDLKNVYNRIQHKFNEELNKYDNEYRIIGAYCKTTPVDLDTRKIAIKKLIKKAINKNQSLVVIIVDKAYKVDYIYKYKGTELDYLIKTLEEYDEHLDNGSNYIESFWLDL